MNNISLKKQTVLGVFWNFLEQFLRRGVGIATTLILAWYLVPEDYGLTAMTAVLAGVAEHKKITVNYEEFFINPKAIYEEIYHKLNKNNCSVHQQRNSKVTFEMTRKLASHVNTINAFNRFY